MADVVWKHDVWWRVGEKVAQSVSEFIKMVTLIDRPSSHSTFDRITVSSLVVYKPTLNQ